MEQSELNWLNKDFLTLCLQNEEGMETVLITNFKAVSAVPEGNNYLTLVSRVSVDYKVTERSDKLQSLSLIIKSQSMNEEIKKINKEIMFIETTFYETFLQEVRKITKLPYVPKYYKAPQSSSIVLEDLQERGFVNINKSVNLNFEHCRLYMIAAASLHAVSFVVHKDNPELVESIGKEMWFTDDKPFAVMFKNMARSACKVFTDTIESTEKFKKYKEVAKRACEDIWNRVVQIRREPSPFLNVLNHGDSWLPNIMFRYDDSGTAEDITLLDFQLLKYGSPACDLLHFIWLNGTHEISRSELEDLYHIYLDTFNQKLEELGYPERMTYANLKAEINRFSLMAVFIVAVLRPSRQDPNLVPIDVFLKDRYEEGNTIYQKWYNEEYTSNEFPKLLEAMEKSGVFDYL